MVVLLATSDVIGRKMGEPKISDDGNPSIKETSSDDKNDSPDDKDAGVVNGTLFSVIHSHFFLPVSYPISVESRE